MSDMIERFNEMGRAYDALCFKDKLNMVISVESMGCVWKMIKWDGYLLKKDCFAVHRNSGNHYVYLWKHMNGDVFYVGSGTGKRCINKNRCMDFLKHLDKGDAVVYIVLDGVDKETSLFYEKYLSGCLSAIGQPLTNKDNNVNRMGNTSFDEWLHDNEERLNDSLTKSVEKTILSGIMCDKDFTYVDVLAREKFLKENGDKYFSSEVWRSPWNQQSNMV